MEMYKELLAKVKEAKTAEELLALAKENNVELTEESAKAYFAKLNAKSGEIADEELENVSGGGCGWNKIDVDGRAYTATTSSNACFTGCFEDNVNGLDFIVKKDNKALRTMWASFAVGNHVCGVCANLGFKDGIGYCTKE